MINVGIPVYVPRNIKICQKYQHWKKEIGRICRMRKIWVIFFGIDALGSATKDLEKLFANLDIHINVNFIQQIHC